MLHGYQRMTAREYEVEAVSPRESYDTISLAPQKTEWFPLRGP